MKFKIDHDYHIHSFLSGCSSDPEQNKDRILQCAVENGLRLYIEDQAASEGGRH